MRVLAPVDRARSETIRRAVVGKFVFSLVDGGSHSGLTETSMVMAARADIVGVARFERGFVGDVQAKMREVIGAAGADH